MIKKLVSFIMCMAPLSALAVTYAPGTGNSVGADGTLNGLDGSTGSIVVKDGNGIVVQGGGINLTGKIYAGVDNLGTAFNQLFIETGTDVPFDIVSGGDITTTGVDVRTGRDLSIGGSAVIDATLGEIINHGKLNIYNINSITTDNINNYGTAAFAGDEMHAGSITNDNVSNDMSFDFESEFGFYNLVSYSAGTVTVSAGNIVGNAIQNNSGSMLIDVIDEIELAANLENSGTLMEIDAGDIVVVGTMKNDNNNGEMIIRADGLEIQGGDGLNLSFVNAGNFNATITGDSYFEYGVDTSRMNITNTFSLDTGSLNFGTEYGDLFLNKLNTLVLNVRNSGLDINTDLVNGVGNSNANFNLSAVSAKFDSVENTGDVLKIKSTGSAVTDGITIVNNVTTASGSNTVLESTKGLEIGGALVNNGTTTLDGETIDLNSVTNNLGTLKIFWGTNSNGSINIDSNVTNNNGTLNIEGREINIGGAVMNVDGADLRIASRNSTDWLNVAIGGNVSGGVDFIGVGKMTIGGNYLFDENSKLHTVVGAPGSEKYWATVGLNDGPTFGQITDNSGNLAEALITIDGKFITNIKDLGAEGVDSLDGGQFGIMLNDIVDAGSAIWLLHAKGGLEEMVDGFGEATQKMRNLYVKFCNADGSLCYNYLDSLGGFTTDENGLPVYLSVRDHDTGDAISADSLYIVFDPRFGGPIEVFKIQPIVDATEDRTNGEYTSAGALDDMIAGRLHEKGFFNRNPIETIPIVFEGTNREEMARELYDRMEQYQIDRDGTGLARFSRLFQPREIEQIVGSVALNEHTNFRDFEDRMLDEFIWNRHRELKKAWVDVDFGMFTQNSKDGKHIDGDRFSVAAGVDWKQSETLLLGMTARVSYSSSNDFDDIDLGYMPNQSIRGRVDVDVANTNVGLGVYLMNILNEKFRFYGNGYLDLHWLDVSRDQTYVDHIDGTGTAFSFMTEWGLMHDWLNQYIVGNVYARAGYNFGFSVTEKVNGSEYMKLESDGYLVLTPGYSLIAQKRIYPSAWFQMRPYLSVGVEYDVLGNPDTAQYKFASANKFTDYDVEIDPLWANGGGGIEFLSATGLQIGLDYRYQYNSDIQMHKIKLSGSYRF
ncbi:hypothetical protein LJC18_00295 [Lachnospiraceae bacterium OttesenSCG-928-E19]|nr:hypothetical protein [Lachnospiraceae bacterium OttesenSCG-928-E19]